MRFSENPDLLLDPVQSFEDAVEVFSSSGDDEAVPLRPLFLSECPRLDNNICRCRDI